MLINDPWGLRQVRVPDGYSLELLTSGPALQMVRHHDRYELLRALKLHTVPLILVPPQAKNRIRREVDKFDWFSAFLILCTYRNPVRRASVSRVARRCPGGGFIEMLTITLVKKKPAGVFSHSPDAARTTPWRLE